MGCNFDPHFLLLGSPTMLIGQRRKELKGERERERENEGRKIGPRRNGEREAKNFYLVDDKRGGGKGPRQRGGEYPGQTIDPPFPFHGDDTTSGNKRRDGI